MELGFVEFDLSLMGLAGIRAVISRIATDCQYLTVNCARRSEDLGMIRTTVWLVLTRLCHSRRCSIW